MSRLLGFVRPDIDPAVAPYDYWIWQATGFPAEAAWDYERLQIQTLPAPDGNILLRVLGPHTAKFPDGVFLHLHVNAEHRPQPKTDVELEPAIQAAWTAAIDRLQPIAPQSGME